MRYAGSYHEKIEEYTVLLGINAAHLLPFGSQKTRLDSSATTQTASTSARLDEESAPVRDRHGIDHSLRAYQICFIEQAFATLQQRRSRPHRTGGSSRSRAFSGFANLNIHAYRRYALPAQEINTTIICQTVSQPETLWHGGDKPSETATGSSC